jgi:hypothetical protein
VDVVTLFVVDFISVMLFFWMFSVVSHVVVGLVVVVESNWALFWCFLSYCM